MNGGNRNLVRLEWRLQKGHCLGVADRGILGASWILGLVSEFRQRIGWSRVGDEGHSGNSGVHLEDLQYIRKANGQGGYYWLDQALVALHGTLSSQEADGFAIASLSTQDLVVVWAASFFILFEQDFFFPPVCSTLPVVSWNPMWSDCTLLLDSKLYSTGPQNKALHVHSLLGCWHAVLLHSTCLNLNPDCPSHLFIV